MTDEKEIIERLYTDPLEEFRVLSEDNHNLVSGWKSAAILGEAQKLVSGDRQDAYGDAVQNHQRIADIFNAATDGEHELTAELVALVLACVKLSRTRTDREGRDSFVDLAAYAAIMGECRRRG